MNFAAAIQTARNELGLSVRSLAQRANLSPVTISAIEHGKRDMSMKTASQIAHAMNIELETLIGLARSLTEKQTEVERLNFEMRKIALMMLRAGTPPDSSENKASPSVVPRKRRISVKKVVEQKSSQLKDIAA